jgi:hypothetical protein
MREQKREVIKMKIRFNISVNEFWNLAQERGWLTKADAFQGQEISKMVDRLNRGNNGLGILEINIKEIANKIEEYSVDVTKEEITSAMLTIIRLYIE